MGSLVQAVCRLLFWIKHGSLSKDDMRVIVALETKFEALLERMRQSAGDDGPDFDQSLQVAQNLYSAIEPGISLSLCRQLYCMVSSADRLITTRRATQLICAISIAINQWSRDSPSRGGGRVRDLSRPRRVSHQSLL